MRIPYALRFSGEKNKLGVLILSEIKRSRQNTLGTLLIQNLELSHNIEGIANKASYPPISDALFFLLCKC
jgi:hypothetical protein